MLNTPIADKALLEKLAKAEKDGKCVFLLENGKVRVTAVSATKAVNEMRVSQRTGLLESYVLSQAYIAALLLTSMIKGRDRIQLSIECAGPIKGLNVEATADGKVRGYLVNNPIPLSEPLSSLDTSLLYGPGFLSVTRLLEGATEPVSGNVMLEYGNLAKDLAVYFSESEQTPTLFYLSVTFDQGGRIVGAGGLFIQAMPGASETLLEKLQQKATKLPSLGKAIAEGVKTEDYIYENLGEFAPEKLAASPIAFYCPCKRESFSQYLKGLPQSEKEEIMKGSFPLELECFNCGSVYQFTKSELEALFKTEETDDLLCSSGGQPG